MRHGIWRSAVIGVVLAAGSAPLSAQVLVTRPVRYGVAGGATLPVSDLRNGSETGWHAGALIDVGIPLYPLGFRVDAMWNQLSEKETDLLSVKNRIIDGTLNAVYSFGGLSATKFYLIGGIGIYNVKTEVEASAFNPNLALSTRKAQPDAPGISRRVAPPSLQLIDGSDGSGSQTKFGVNVGAGFRFQFTGFTTFIEARWHTILTNGDNAQMVPISVGIAF
jgi:opacity protein-like surface antigen